MSTFWDPRRERELSSFIKSCRGHERILPIYVPLGGRQLTTLGTGENGWGRPSVERGSRLIRKSERGGLRHLAYPKSKSVGLERKDRENKGKGIIVKYKNYPHFVHVPETIKNEKLISIEKEIEEGKQLRYIRETSFRSRATWDKKKNFHASSLQRLERVKGSLFWTVRGQGKLSESDGKENGLMHRPLGKEDQETD